MSSIPQIYCVINCTHTMDVHIKLFLKDTVVEIPLQKTTHFFVSACVGLSINSFFTISHLLLFPKSEIPYFYSIFIYNSHYVLKYMHIHKYYIYYAVVTFINFVTWKFSQLFNFIRQVCLAIRNGIFLEAAHYGFNTVTIVF